MPGTGAWNAGLLVQSMAAQPPSNAAAKGRASAETREYQRRKTGPAHDARVLREKRKQLTMGERRQLNEGTAVCGGWQEPAGGERRPVFIIVII